MFEEGCKAAEGVIVVVTWKSIPGKENGQAKQKDSTHCV